MFKKILISIAFSISMLNYPTYAEIINSENNMYKQYFNNGKIDQKKILNELASQNISFSGLKDFLLDKNNNISTEEAKQIISTLKDNNKIIFKNKLFFYFRYYHLLDSALILQIKNTFKDEELLNNEYFEPIVEFYSFIPYKERKELIFHFMDNCLYCYKFSELLSKEYDKDLLEYYIYKVAPKNQDDKYKPQNIIVNLYYKLDEKLKEKLFDDIREKIVKEDILSYKNLFDFIYLNYSIIDSKYKNLIYYVAENSNDLNFIIYFDNIKNENKELYKKIPEKDIDIFTVKYFDKFKKVYNFSSSDDSINNFRSILLYYINNFKKLSEPQKKSFKEILSNLKNETGLSYQITQEYKNIDTDIKQLVFEKIIYKEIDASTSDTVYRNYKSFSKDQIEKVENKVLEKGFNKELLYSIKNNFNNLPEDYNKSLLLRLSKNTVNQEVVFDVLLSNFDKLSKPLKDLFFNFLNNKVGLGQSYNYVMINNENKEISNIVFSNLSKISTQDLAISFFSNLYNLDLEKELINKVLNELSIRNDLKPGISPKSRTKTN